MILVPRSGEEVLWFCHFFLGLTDIQDTEFPGIVARPIGQFTTKADYHYQTLRCNVDLLKMIQLGVTLFALDGSLPPSTDPSNAQASQLANFTPSPFSWQFNFAFSLSADMYAQESTTMLEKAGIDFAMHEKNGIEPHQFGALLYSSGLVLEPEVNWISFHSGYDFGYLMKIMLQMALPEDEGEFHKLLNIFFPSLYDIKFLLKHAARNQTVNDNSQQLTGEAGTILQKLQTKSGLQDIADELGINRIGIAHQAGSDSLLTGQVYFKMREKIFGGQIDHDKYSGLVWGLNGQMSIPHQQRDFAAPNMNGATFYNANGNPSTPPVGQVGLAQHHGQHQGQSQNQNQNQNQSQNQNQNHTPGHQSGHGALGHPASGGGGAFGQYQYAKA
jgi:CCR4-NOT transcription complex subunit 7/8